MEKDFLIKYWQERRFEKLKWRGIPAWKLAFDLFLYAEIIDSCLPDFIIETGTLYGGSTLFLADFCSLINHGQVITIDTDMSKVASTKILLHPLITRIQGSSIASETLGKIRRRVEGKTSMVILDSVHHYKYLSLEMEHYKYFVSPEMYMIVEDGYLGDIVSTPAVGKGEGPNMAIREFLDRNKDFVLDEEICERHMVSFNPMGYLKRRQ